MDSRPDFRATRRYRSVVKRVAMFLATMEGPEGHFVVEDLCREADRCPIVVLLDCWEVETDVLRGRGV